MDEKYINIIKALTAKSKSKLATWNKTSSINEFKIHLKSSTITTDKWQDNHGENVIEFVIRNDKGDVIFRYVIDETEDKEIYSLLSHFYDSVKESYYNIDSTIKDIFDELSSDRKIGEEGLPF